MLLHDLIHRVACSQLYVLNRLAQLKMDLRSYFVLKLHITSLSEEALTEEEYNEYLNQSQEILSDCLSSYQHYYIARGTQDCFVVHPCRRGSAHYRIMQGSGEYCRQSGTFSAVYRYFQLQ